MDLETTKAILEIITLLMGIFAGLYTFWLWSKPNISQSNGSSSSTEKDSDWWIELSAAFGMVLFAVFGGIFGWVFGGILAAVFGGLVGMLFGGAIGTMAGFSIDGVITWMGK